MQIMEAFTFNDMEIAGLATAGFLLLIQVLYYFGIYNRINRHCRAAQQGKIDYIEELPPLSVIICAHDEAENLRRNLETVLCQDYPQFEVIVVNDGNSDESDACLTLLEEKYPHLYHSFVPDSPRGVSHQKLAATIGIKASKYDWLVFTRPDSAPQSNQWLRKLARNFTPSTQIVLGYHRYNSGENRLQRKAGLYGLFYAMRYLGFALAGRPYMGNGHNLAYRKELFYKHKGFSAHLDIPQGDDDLFINQVATPDNTRVETDPDAIMNIPETLTRKHWHDEQAGYAATARHYRGLQRYCNGMETTTRLLFYIAWAATCILSLLCQHWLAAGIAVVSFALRFTMQASVINRTARNLGEPGKYYLSLPLFDLTQPLQSWHWKRRSRLQR